MIHSFWEVDAQVIYSILLILNAHLNSRHICKSSKEVTLHLPNFSYSIYRAVSLVDYCEALRNLGTLAVVPCLMMLLVHVRLPLE
jgi:hypothetical protein